MPQPSGLVVGAGISGLSTTWRLHEAGFAVTIVARERPERTTSAVAPAIWLPSTAALADRVHAWALRGYSVYAEEASREACVWFAPVRALFASRSPPPWVTGVAGLAPLDPGDLPAGFVAGHGYDAPLIEMPAYLHVLEGRLGAAGIGIDVRAVDDPATLGGAADVVMLCAGLGEGALTRDPDTFPVWGEVVRVAPGALNHVLIDEDHPEGPTYAIPRRDDIVLGDTALVGVERDGPDAATAEEATALALGGAGGRMR